jgi:hypothetical protein
VAWLHLAVLWAFAVAQPLFNILADDPAFFVARGNTTGDILLLALGLVLVPPTLLVGIEAVFLRLPHVRRWLHVLFVAALTAVFALQLIADAAPRTSSAFLIPLALLCGAAGGAAYMRTRFVPSMLTVLSPAPFLFLAFFLLLSDVSKLVLPQDEASAGAAVGSDTPVIFVVLDEFSGLHLQGPEGRINARRFPGFAELAGNSTWYRNATTVADQTSRAVPAILSGTEPSNDKLPIAGDYPNNLFTLLGGDYTLDVRESASHLCPDSLCERRREAQPDRLRALARDLRTVSLRGLLPDDLADDLPAVNQGFGNFDGGAQIVDGAVKGQDQGVPPARGRAFGGFSKEIGSDPGGKALHFQHILLPHIPWIFLPDGQQYSENGRPVPGLDVANDHWSDLEWAPRQAFQRYMLQLEYTDRLVGALVEHLRETGLFDRALVVVVADHGVSFRANDGRRRVTSSNFADLASVPMFIKAPGQKEGRTDQSHVRTVDVMPTVADYLGVKLPWKSEGVSVREPIDGPDVVRVTPPDGKTVEMDFDAFVRQRDEFVGQLADLFGTRGDAGIYAAGVDPRLAGRNVSTMSVARQPGARVELDASEAFTSVDPAGAVVPAFITGSLTGVAPGTTLAVALNGKIDAVAYAFEDRGQVSFSALVPPAAFRSGENRVKVFALRGSGQDTTLVALGQSAAERFELVDADGGQVLRSSSGEEARVSAGAVTGFVEGIDAIPGGVSVRGWATVPGEGPAQQIVVYAGDRLIAQGAPTEVREDVAKARGAESLKSGFVLSGNDPEGSSPAAEVHVYAIRGDVASELPK